MHECNAMQILETKKKKNTKTKEQWSQRKSSEAQGPGQQNSSGTQNHTNYLTRCLKLTSIKRFGEDVNIMSFSRNILKTQSFFQQDT